MLFYMKGIAMKLPYEFELKMKKLLKDEYEAYLKSYDFPKYSGLRINTLKIDKSKWEKINPFPTTRNVPWCPEGYYYFDTDVPSKHPYYYAGLYYIQEPSAMAPGAYLPISEGDKVLDLCAAPGGKSTQIAAKLGHSGVLVSNDISATRVKALLKNIENFGVRNAVVINETPKNLAEKFRGYFDKILIDAPCSGEGMFRKQPSAIQEWEKHHTLYPKMQEEILEHADKMLKPGGMILYSTCTFSPEENEGMIDSFLKKHSNYKVIPLTPVGGIQQAHPEWADGDSSIEGALRLWPHQLEGEGHFVCLMAKIDGKEESCSVIKAKKTLRDVKGALEFFDSYTTISPDTPVVQVKDRIYLYERELPDLTGLRVIRSGMLLGECKNKRFEPAHAMVLGYNKEVFKYTIDLASDDELVTRYLKGETIVYDAPKGYHILCIDGYPLGFVKSQNGLLKNQYPPSWRLMG